MLLQRGWELGEEETATTPTGGGRVGVTSGVVRETCLGAEGTDSADRGKVKKGESVVRVTPTYLVSGQQEG